MRWNLFPEKQGTCWEMHRELRLICQKDNIYLKTSSKSNVGRTHHYIFKFFLKRASIYDFCCNTNQNNPHILKYDSYDRSRLLQPCGKFFSWASPIPLGNFYPLAPPPLRNFHWPSVGGGGNGYFLESHNGPLRAGGRIGRAPFPYELKHPVILPYKHHATDLIMRDHHQRMGHLDQESVLSSLRKKYWILKRRSAVRRVLNKCSDCQKRKAKPAEQ